MHTARAPWWESLSQDLKYAARGVAVRPGFAAVVICALALGIGANAVMFGVVDRLLLRAPAHVREPERVTRIYFRQQDASTSPVTTYPAVAALRDEVPALGAMAGVARATLTLGRGPDAQELKASLVSGNFFQLLGVHPALGRFFLPDEDRPPLGSHVVVLSHGFWQRHFGGGRSAVGARLLLNNTAFTVVGVAPPHFSGVELDRVDAWLPLSTLAASRVGDDWHRSPDTQWLVAIGRLAPGATRERAGAEATVAYRRAVRSWEDTWLDTLASVVAGPVVAARGPQGAPAEARVSLWLVGVSGVVLLVACANVANLLLARAVRRRREIAVRLALGIGRGRLVRQLMVEALVLAFAAAAVALLLAHLGGQAVRSLLLPDVAWAGSPVDGRVLAFTTAAALLTALLAGLAPAVQAGGTSVVGALRLGARDGGGRRSRVRTGLLVLQAALSVVLLVGAGLFVRSLHSVRSLDVGVDLDRVLLVRLELRNVNADQAQRRELYRRAHERARSLPGVESAALIGGSVPRRSGMSSPLAIPGRDTLPALPNGGPYHSRITPAYFATIGARVVRGRGLTDADEAVRARVMLVNETLAASYWPRENPVGQCVLLGDEKACTEIVGVVENVMLFNVVGDERGQLYLPRTHPAAGNDGAEALLVRASSAAGSIGLVAALRREVQALAPDMPYVGVERFADLVAPELRPWRLGATMFGIFGLLALAIAAIGLYGAIAYAVVQRTHEIGVRVALGAQRTDVVRLVLLDCVRVVGAGLLLGTGAALAAGRWLEPLLHQTSSRDPATFAVVSLALATVGIAASLVPAWRATRVDLAVALRAE